jgi:hypothetical protein
MTKTRDTIRSDRYDQYEFIPTRHLLTPVNPHLPLHLSLSRHPWHVTGPNNRPIAFHSNYECAVMTADRHIEEEEIFHLNQLERVLYISAVRITHIKSNSKWAKVGNEWVPITGLE